MLSKLVDWKEGTNKDFAVTEWRHSRKMRCQFKVHHVKLDRIPHGVPGMGNRRDVHQNISFSRFYSIESYYLMSIQSFVVRSAALHARAAA